MAFQFSAPCYRCYVCATSSEEFWKKKGVVDTRLGISWLYESDCVVQANKNWLLGDCCPLCKGFGGWPPISCPVSSLRVQSLFHLHMMVYSSELSVTRSYVIVTGKVTSMW